MDDRSHALPSAAEPREPTRIDPRLLEILVCPLTRARSNMTSSPPGADLPAAQLAYPIRDGIPIMLPEEARQLED